MFEFQYFGKRFDLTLTSNYKDFSLGVLINYFGVTVDLLFVQVAVHFKKDHEAPGRI